jgi:hypothetical protein
LKDCKTAATAAVFARSLGVDSSTREIQPERHQPINRGCKIKAAVLRRLTDGRQGESVGEDPDGAEGDETGTQGRRHRLETEATDRGVNDGHECTRAKHDGSPSDPLHKVEGASNPQQKDAVNDHRTEEGVAQTCDPEWGHEREPSKNENGAVQNSFTDSKKYVVYPNTNGTPTKFWYDKGSVAARQRLKLTHLKSATQSLEP